MAGLEEKLTADEKRTLQNLLKLPDEVTIYRNFPWCEHEWDYPTIDENCQALLSQCKDLPTMSLSDDVQETIQRSRQFPVPFPIQSVRLEQLQLKRPIDRLKKNIVSTYPIIHERVLLLMTRFLDYKREYGSSIEQKFYTNMTLPQLIDRILKKRAITFYGAYDKYMLITGKKGRDGWELVGTEKEKPPLVLRNCLSYDEQKICSMVYVSGYTENINDGERQNKGVVNEDNIEPNAVIIGIIGPRFKRTFKMEYEDIIISEKQNCPENGYGTSEVQINEAKSMWRKMWTEFYQIPNYSWEVLKPELKTKSKNKCWLYMANFVRMPKSDEMFCNEVYYKRLRVTIECVLLEAEARAAAAGKFAFVNVIGAGLGKWRVSPHQEDVYVQSFLERISTLLHTGQLDHISDINFSYIKLSPPVLGLFDKEPGRKIFKRFNANPKHPKGGINMQLESREPSAKLSDEHQGKLLVMTYAWDGNAHPGNEFWIGLLAGSGDSAAACATQISELHNAYINPAVCAANTKIVGRNGLASLAEYCTDIMVSGHSG